MESFEITLSRQQLEQLRHPDLLSFFSKLFIPGSANYNKLTLDLQREFRQGGSPDVSRLAFDRVVYNPASGKGSFRIVLDVRFTFGCEDSVTEKKDQTSEWTFSIDDARSTLTFFSSPFTESRSTADEF